MKTFMGLFLALSLMACSSIAPVPSSTAVVPVQVVPVQEAPIAELAPGVIVDPIDALKPGYVCTPPPELVCTKAP